MKKFLIALMAFFLLIGACPVSVFAVSEESAENKPSTGTVINVYNWGEYISNGVDGCLDVNAEFTKLTGIEVNYTTYETNEALYAKLAGGGASYDVIIPSDYMIARMIEEDMLEELDFSNIPNFSYVDEKFRNPLYDPDNAYSVPYTWGLVGLFYNKNYVEEPTSWHVLWDEQYSGKILMFDNPRDAFAIAQSILGVSFNSTYEDDWIQAAALLKEQKPLVQAYVMDQIFDKMESGEAWLAPYYAGDAAILVEESEDIGFIIPQKESTNFFVDAMCIPKGSEHKTEAEMYIDFMCNPEISAANCEYIGYSTPISAAKELLPEEISSNPIYYPSEETLSYSEIFAVLPENINLLLDELWAEVKMGGPGDTITLIIILGVFLLLYIGILIWKRLRRRQEI